MFILIGSAALLNRVLNLGDWWKLLGVRLLGRNEEEEEEESTFLRVDVVDENDDECTPIASMKELPLVKERYNRVPDVGDAFDAKNMMIVECF